MDVDKRVEEIHIMNLRLIDVYLGVSYSDFPLLISAFAGDVLVAKTNFVFDSKFIMRCACKSHASSECNRPWLFM